MCDMTGANRHSRILINGWRRRAKGSMKWQSLCPLFSIFHHPWSAVSLPLKLIKELHGVSQNYKEWILIFIKTGRQDRQDFLWLIRRRRLGLTIFFWKMVKNKSNKSCESCLKFFNIIESIPTKSRVGLCADHILKCAMPAYIICPLSPLA